MIDYEIFLKNNLHKNLELKLDKGDNIIYGRDLVNELHVKINKTLSNKRLLKITIETNFSCKIEALLKNLTIIATKVEKGGIISEDVVSYKNVYRSEDAYNGNFCFNFSILDNFVLYFEKKFSQTHGQNKQFVRDSDLNIDDFNDLIEFYEINEDNIKEQKNDKVEIKYKRKQLLNLLL